jgi:lysophospholipase L1-like esterase
VRRPGALILAVFAMVAFTEIHPLHQTAARSDDEVEKCILTIGDSNGAGPGKWPDKLQGVLGKGYKIVNNSESGRTIGFDNLGTERLNTLKQIDYILDAAVKENSGNAFDMVLICLGTNDCKAIFDSLQSEVAPNLAKLVGKISAFDFPEKKTPRVVIISPPPYGKASANTTKYHGADKRVARLVPQFRDMAEKTHLGFIDLYSPLVDTVDKCTVDGVHFTDEGYDQITSLIASAIVKH